MSAQLAYRRGGIGAYATTDLEGRARAATPAELMVMLFDAIDTSLRAARLHLQAGRIAEKAKALSRAVRLVNGGLRAPLDTHTDDPLSGQLVSLYAYVVRRLIEANASNDIGKLDEAARLLQDIGTSWRTVATREATHAN
ncbi:MAG TPA: flagellar export chaperone FliS [Nevskiaceae bacterium]|nr:flagellar export chaperone FliS [Nevskiaceae bacterium]